MLPPTSSPGHHTIARTRVNRYHDSTGAITHNSSVADLSSAGGHGQLREDQEEAGLWDSFMYIVRKLVALDKAAMVRDWPGV
jgi:hypothetical protein